MPKRTVRTNKGKTVGTRMRKGKRQHVVITGAGKSARKAKKK